MMMSEHSLVLFASTSLILGLAPGPDNVFVLTQSALLGRKAGLLVTLGLCTGLLVHTLLVALGVAVLFQTSALAFSALKFCGAAYLVYLAFKAFRAGVSELPDGDPLGKGARDTLLGLYFRGIVMNLTNPKVAIFFLAFLPQFANPAAGSMTGQLIILGLLFDLITLLLFSAIALAAGYLGGWLRQSKQVQMWMNRIAGSVFLALAIRLALVER